MKDKATKTVKVTANSHKWIDDNRNGTPRTKFLNELFSKIEVTWTNEFKFKVKGKK